MQHLVSCKTSISQTNFLQQTSFLVDSFHQTDSSALDLQNSLTSGSFDSTIFAKTDFPPPPTIDLTCIINYLLYIGYGSLYLHVET